MEDFLYNLNPPSINEQEPGTMISNEENKIENWMKCVSCKKWRKVLKSKFFLNKINLF
jgi:hypothetical protein